MKAIYLSWQDDEANGVDEVAVFSDDNDPNIAKILSELQEGWSDDRWIVMNYTPPPLNPRNVDECRFSASFFTRRKQAKPTETVEAQQNCCTSKMFYPATPPLDVNEELEKLNKLELSQIQGIASDGTQVF